MQVWTSHLHKKKPRLEIKVKGQELEPGSFKCYLCNISTFVMF